MEQHPRWRRVAVYVSGAVVGLIFVVMGAMKFDATGPWAGLFAGWGYPPWFRLLIGVLEVLWGASLLVPRLAAYGAAGLLVVMAGAFLTRLRDGLSGDHVGIAVYALLLAWVLRDGWRRRWGGAG